MSAAVLAELRAWAGAEDAAYSECKSVRSENLDSALRASTSTGSTWRRAMQRGAGRVSQRQNAQVQRAVGEEEADRRSERRGPGGAARVGGR